MVLMMGTYEARSELATATASNNMCKIRTAIGAYPAHEKPPLANEKKIHMSHCKKYQTILSHYVPHLTSPALPRESPAAAAGVGAGRHRCCSFSCS